jgi:lysozyme family protein
LSRIVVARKDSGGHTFNFSEFLGNGAATGISTLYYPAQDRAVSSSLSNWSTQLAVDALGNELKEFWPDIHRKLQKK